MLSCINKQMFSRADQMFTLKFDFWEIFNSEQVYFVQ